MTQKEWETKEKFYTNQLASKDLVLPIDPTSSDLTAIEAKIDELYSQARLDLAHCKRQFENIERKFKAAHKETYLIVKDQGKTEKEKEALAVSYLKNNALDGMSITIYQAFDIAEYRLLFIDAVVDILKEKHARCITDSGLMKLEVSLGAA